MRTLVAARALEAGSHEAVWNGRDGGGRTVAAGVYVYRLVAGSFSEAKRMTLVKSQVYLVSAD